MHGWTTTIVLLTIATFLDDLLHFASSLSSEQLKSLHLIQDARVSSSPPLSLRWWFVLAATASPVIGSEQGKQHVIHSQDPFVPAEAEREEVYCSRESHATWPTLVLNDNDEIQEGEDEPIGSNAPMGWADPRLRGGQMLDFVFPGLGEPLNVIISGLSDPYVLTPRGLLHYAQSLGFSTECLGIHLGMLHVANLGDALQPQPTPSRPSRDDPPIPTPRIPLPTGGNKTEQLLARQNYDWPAYGWPDYGTCWESLVGGNHFRAWKQDGAGARTGAWFLAASREMWVGMGHAISPDGYNGGRDGIVKRALKPTRWSPTEEGIWWRTTLKYNTTLIPAGNQGINHKLYQDGRVAILTVRRRNGPPRRKELIEAWGELALEKGASSWMDWEARAEARRARWELEGIDSV